MNQIKTTLRLAALIGFWAMLPTPAFAGKCPVDHCSKVSENFNNTCKADGLSGQPVYTDYQGSKCWCPCSCFALGTSLTAAHHTTQVELVKKHDQVRTPAGAVEVEQPMPPTEVVDHPVISLRVDNQAPVLVSLNHPLISALGVVTAAENLAVGDQILSEAGTPVTVTHADRIPYTGTLYNFILNGQLDSGADRIILAGGVQSGDWQVQSHRDYRRADVGLRELIVAIDKKKAK